MRNSVLKYVVQKWPKGCFCRATLPKFQSKSTYTIVVITLISYLIMVADVKKPIIEGNLNSCIT